MKIKKYKDTIEMIKDILPNEKTSDSLVKRITSQQLIITLMVKRSCLKMSKKDVAKKMGCSEKKVDRIEQSKDRDLKVKDLQDYAKAVGLDLVLESTK